MKDKPNDIEYLGYEVNKNKIDDVDLEFYKEGLKHYTYFVTERQNIFKKRQQGLPPMWTDSKVLQNNRFTNVRRENDRVSRWLIEHISKNPDLTLEDKLWRSIIFRMYNTIRCGEIIEIDSPNFWNNIDRNVKRLEDIEHDSEIYTNAYRIVQVKSIYKKYYPNNHHRSHILLYFNDLRNKIGNLSEIVIENADIAYRWLLRNIYGAGPFIAYQIFVDWTYIPEYPISENHYVVVGPGCRSGLNFLIKDYKGLTAEEAIFWIRDNFNKVFKDYPDLTPEKLFDNEPKDNRNWNVMSIENTFCEFGKYIYCIENKHKKPRRYKYDVGN